ELPGGEPRALKQRPRLTDEDQLQLSPVSKLTDHGKRCTAAWCGQRPGVAMGEDAPSGGEPVGAVDRDRLTRGSLLGFDRARFAEWVCSSGDPIRCPEQVQRGRASAA